jgi:hypothetical protein
MDAAKVVERGSTDLPWVGRPCRLARGDHLAESVSSLAERHEIRVGLPAALRPREPTEAGGDMITLAVELDHPRDDAHRAQSARGVDLVSCATWT